MKIGTAIEKFLYYHARAIAQDYIQKPVSWALYHTWQWADTYERPRGKKEKNNE